MSQALRKLTGSISKSNTIVVFINQIRMKIGVMFGNPETTTGGQALKFYASVRMEVRRAAAIKNGDDSVGSRTRVKVVKNKVSAPFREAEFDVMYGTGISKEGDVLDLGADSEIIQKSGTWFTYGTERLGQGRENAKNYLREHPETMKKIDGEVRAKLLAKHKEDKAAQNKGREESAPGRELAAAAGKALPATAVKGTSVADTKDAKGNMGNKRSGASATVE